MKDEDKQKRVDYALSAWAWGLANSGYSPPILQRSSHGSPSEPLGLIALGSSFLKEIVLIRTSGGARPF